MSLMVSTGSEPKALSDLIKYESNRSFTRREGTVRAGSGSARDVDLFEILGETLFGTPVGAAQAGGNTGNGTLGPIALKANTQQGVYTLECIATATNGGTFAVFDPNGHRMADATVGVAYDNGEIAFEISDGGTDFALADGFTITVPEGNGHLVPLDLTAVDGTQYASDIALQAKSAPDGSTVRIMTLTRGEAIIERSQLIYPAGATTDQKAAIDAELLARGILVETGL